MFEKLTSGMALGTLARLLLRHALLTAVEKPHPWDSVFQAAVTTWLALPSAITTSDLATAMRDYRPDLPQCRAAVAAAINRSSV